MYHAIGGLTLFFTAGCRWTPGHVRKLHYTVFFKCRASDWGSSHCRQWYVGMDLDCFNVQTFTVVQRLHFGIVDLW